ncbi:uncharacterized protein LOC127876111 isoform X2 [Dreissena polymorpha]|uniref:uncharacterized protein LOC127876111 isoform X2 n=2 Tax=Dreissena polymorpha TaxID=45954 RepID=UPI0022652944|nr:uncharacterized protein LOC127876111 isoform X2 [Dreissena polymorpha]
MRTYSSIYREIETHQYFIAKVTEYIEIITMAGFSFWKFCVHFWIACCIPVRSLQSQHDWLLNSFILSADNTTTELCQILPLDFCHVTDVCYILNKWMNLPICPILFDDGSGPKGWDCQCPFEQGTYIMPREELAINVYFPFRLHADFNIIAKIKENGVPLGCGSFKFSVRKATDPEVFNVT